MHLVAVVDTKQCQLLKNEFKQLEIDNKQYKFKRIDNNSICIPLTENAKQILSSSHVDNNMYSLKNITFKLQQDEHLNKCQHSEIKTPSKKMKLQIKYMMETKYEWEECMLNEIPTTWEKYGNCIIFDAETSFNSSFWNKAGADLWKCICNVLKVKHIAFKSCIQSDNFRTPNVQVVWGNTSWVDYIDNGIYYGWDLERNMFCAGNAPERHRISTLMCSGEVIVDMYAGIGYFTLPYLVYTGATLVHACEWNPYAVKALKFNLQKNNVHKKCIIYEGDSNKVCPKNIADRVNMGLLPSCETGWKSACAALKPTGGVLHIHENVGSYLKKKSVSLKQNVNSITSFPKNMLNEENSGHNCDTCNNIIMLYDFAGLNIMHSISFNNTSLHFKDSFFMDNNTLMPNCICSVHIKWKKVEWKMWALHVCHRLCSLFHELYGNAVIWRVRILNLNHVKSYAPHIDHLVLDVQCSPLEEACYLTE